MSSSGDNNNNNRGGDGDGDSSITYSSLSAKSSLKRSRVLYAMNPQTAFIPTADPTILNDSINRRKQRVSRHYQQIDHRGNGTLAIVADYPANGASSINNNTLQMKPLSSSLSSSSVTSSAMAIQKSNVTRKGEERNTTNDNKSGGILVVRIYVCVCVCVCFTCVGLTALLYIHISHCIIICRLTMYYDVSFFFGTDILWYHLAHFPPIKNNRNRINRHRTDSRYQPLHGMHLGNYQRYCHLIWVG